MPCLLEVDSPDTIISCGGRAGDTCFRTDVAAGCSGTLTAGYAVGVRWSGGPLDKIQMLSGVGVAGAHVVSAGRCCYTAEE
ncbi:hypothetical protein WJX77_000614 [Trebouxia sp. C0004]